MKRFFPVLVISVILVSALSISVSALQTSAIIDDGQMTAWQFDPLMFHNVTGVYSLYQTGGTGLQSFGFNSTVYDTWYAQTPGETIPYNLAYQGLDFRPFAISFRSNFNNYPSNPSTPLYSINFSLDLRTSAGTELLYSVPYGMCVQYSYDIWIRTNTGYSLDPANFSGTILYYHCSKPYSEFASDYSTLSPMYIPIHAKVASYSQDEIDYLRNHYTGAEYLGSSGWKKYTIYWEVNNTASNFDSGYIYDLSYPYLTFKYYNSNSAYQSAFITYSFPRNTTVLDFAGNAPFDLGFSSIRFLYINGLTHQQATAAEIASAFEVSVSSIFDATTFDTNLEYYKSQFGYTYNFASPGLGVFRSVIDSFTAYVPTYANLIYSVIFVTILVVVLGWIKHKG